jgi:hypothetical protein
MTNPNFLETRAPGQVILVLSTSLPCAILAPTDANPNARCGAPAMVAHAYPAPESMPNLLVLGIPRPGEWVILPVCSDCTKKAAAAYGLVKE